MKSCNFCYNGGEFFLGVGWFGEFGKFRGICHFERSKKSIRILKYALNLWILRYAQYDKTGQYDNGFVILSFR